MIYLFLLFSFNGDASLEAHLEGLSNQGAIEYLEANLESDPNDLISICWLSYMNTRVGWLLKEDGASKESYSVYYNRSMELAERAGKIDSDHWAYHFAMACAAGSVAEVAGAKARVKASFKIREHCEKSLALNPDNRHIWYTLGRWNQEIFLASPAERTAAKALFGGLPKGASLEKAADCYKKAISLRPQHALYYYHLATCYDALGKDDLVKKVLSKGVTLKDPSEEGPSYIAKMKAALSDL